MVLESLLSTLAGGATGTIAGVANSYFQVKLAEARLPLEMAKQEADVEIAKQERRARNDVAMEETQQTIIRAEADMFKAAHESDKATYGMWLVDAFRGLIRPMLTIAHFWVLFELMRTLWEMNHSSATDEFWMELFRHTVYTFLYLATVVIGYWFAARGARAPRIG